MHETHLSL